MQYKHKNCKQILGRVKKMNELRNERINLILHLKTTMGLFNVY
jgi:hypothetical protein